MHDVSVFATSCFTRSDPSWYRDARENCKEPKSCFSYKKILWWFSSGKLDQSRIRNSAYDRKEARWLETAFGLKRERSFGELCVPKTTDWSARLPVRPAMVSSQTLFQVSALPLYPNSERPLKLLIRSTHNPSPSSDFFANAIFVDNWDSKFSKIEADLRTN